MASGGSCASSTDKKSKSKTPLEKYCSWMGVNTGTPLYSQVREGCGCAASLPLRVPGSILAPLAGPDVQQRHKGRSRQLALGGLMPSRPSGGGSLGCGGSLGKGSGVSWNCPECRKGGGTELLPQNPAGLWFWARPIRKVAASVAPQWVLSLALSGSG